MILFDYLQTVFEKIRRDSVPFMDAGTLRKKFAAAQEANEDALSARVQDAISHVMREIAAADVYDTKVRINIGLRDCRAFMAHRVVRERLVDHFVEAGYEMKWDANHIVLGDIGSFTISWAEK